MGESERVIVKVQTEYGSVSLACDWRSVEEATRDLAAAVGYSGEQRVMLTKEGKQLDSKQLLRTLVEPGDVLELVTLQSSYDNPDADWGVIGFPESE